jgi:hypothetical protein
LLLHFLEIYSPWKYNLKLINMKSKLFKALAAIVLFLIPYLNFGQAPDLGNASGFVLFSASGAFDVLGASTVVTGDVGTDVGQFTGFPPGTLVGQLHVADPATASAATDVLTAYQYLDQMTCGIVKTTPLGNGEILAPNVYCIGEAATLNGDLTLDANGNPDALFVFQIDGAFATSVNARVLLLNEASLCNVYWQINGAFTLDAGSVFRGNVIAGGAIHLLEGSDLYGRALTTAGAIDLHNNIVTLGVEAVASTILAEGPASFCIGDSVLLSGNTGGIWSTGATTPTIMVKTSGDYFVTNTAICNSVNSNHIIVSAVDCGGPAVPISSWALILGGALIAVFLFVRYRRMI